MNEKSENYLENRKKVVRWARRNGLTEQGVEVLIALGKGSLDESINCGELSKRTGHDPAQVSRDVHVLTEKELLEYGICGKDRRARTIRLNDQGRQVYQEFVELFD